MPSVITAEPLLLSALSPNFLKFIHERKYLRNVSPATIEWYEQSLAWLGNEAPTEDDLKALVMRMREKGLKATSCNNRIRAVNAYLKWAGLGMRVPKMKEPQEILPTFTAVQIRLLIHWKPKTGPKGWYQQRLHLLALILLDTGCRISEALGLRAMDVDMENLLLTLNGKGRKQRKVPFSFELRKVLWRYMAGANAGGTVPTQLLLGTKQHSLLNKRVALRDMKALCKRLGFVAPARTLHAFRHTFALNYLRSGGSVFHLQKVLGHSSLEMTRRYANLLTEDLQAMHQRVSLLAA